MARPVSSAAPRAVNTTGITDAGPHLSLRGMRFCGLLAALLLAASLLPGPAVAAVRELTHISFHSASGMYDRFNELFAEHYRSLTGDEVRITMMQDTDDRIVAAVNDGSIEADLVTLSSSVEVDEIVDGSGRVAGNWRILQPNNSSPFSSALVLMVRAGNPLGIRDWDDIITSRARMVTASPRMSGFGRYGYYNVFVHAYLKFQGDQKQIMDYIRSLNRQIAYMTPSTKVSRELFWAGRGDVLPIWESEALRHERESGGQAGTFELIYPTVNVLCRPRIVVVTGNSDSHGVTDVAGEYVRFLYSDQGQELLADYGLRPVQPAASRRHRRDFASIRHIDMSQFGDLKAFKRDHFRSGGLYDRHVRFPDAQSASVSGGGEEAEPAGSE